MISDSLRPYGPEPARLLCPWDSPVYKTEVDCHFLSAGDLPDPGIEPVPLKSPALAGGFFTTSATYWRLPTGLVWECATPGTLW